MKKIISLKSTDREILDLCEKISKMDIDCSIESKTIYNEDSENISSFRIKIYGYDKDKVNENYRILRSLIDRVHKKYNPDSKGFYEFQLSELKYPINKNLILDALDMLKIEYIYNKEGNSIKCKLSLDEFDNLLKELYEINKDPKLNYLINIGSKPVKNLIILLTYFTNRDMEEIIEECIENEFFRVDEDGTIHLNRNPKIIKEYYIKEGHDE